MSPGRFELGAGRFELSAKMSPGRFEWGAGRFELSHHEGYRSVLAFKTLMLAIEYPLCLLACYWISFMLACLLLNIEVSMRVTGTENPDLGPTRGSDRIQEWVSSNG